jgi:hypothetical protein
MMGRKGNIYSPIGQGKIPLHLGLTLCEIHGCLSTASNLEFLEDVFEIVSDSLLAQGQRDGDFLVRESLGY